MARVLLLSLASVLVTAQQPQFHQQSDFSQQAIPPIDPTISFNYGYEVNDKDTGDTKSHQEALENGVLRGSYSVVQPDGNRRVVEYEADEVSGFQAKVRYEPGFPVHTPPQRRPSVGGSAFSQGSRFSSGSSSSSSPPRFSSSRPNRPSQGAQLSGTLQGSSFTASAGSSASSHGSRFSSGSSSSSSPSRFSSSRPNRPSQGAQFSGTQQSSSFTGGISAQGTRFSAGTSQGPNFGQSGPTRQGAPSRFIGGPPSQTSQFQGSRTSSQSSEQSSSSTFSNSVSQNRPTGSAGVSASQGSQFRPVGFPHNPTGSTAIGITSSRRPQSGAQGFRFSSGPSSQSASVSSQNTFSSSSSQAGQSSSSFSGPFLHSQRSSTGSKPSGAPPVSPGSRRPGATGPRPSGARPVSPGSRRPGAQLSSQPNAQSDVAVQLAEPGSFSQGGTSSSTSSAQSGTSIGGIRGANFGASSQSGISGSSFSGASQSSTAFKSGQGSQSNFNNAAFQQDIYSPRFQSGAPSASIQSSNAFQSRQGSRFQGGPAFDQLISSSLLVTDENLDGIEAVELASAGFDDSNYAYRLVPVPVNN